MRISDWSADVCSSDLTFYLRLMYERFGYPGLFAAYNAGPARYAAHLRPGRTLPGETRSYLATLERKIGIASCRERVCQYVSISVVAVSLIKKIYYSMIVSYCSCSDYISLFFMF